MSDEKVPKSRSQKNPSLLAAAVLSAGMLVGGATSSIAAPAKAPAKDGDINALYKDNNAPTLKNALNIFNNLPPEHAHAYMITLESGWDHWQRDKKTKQLIIYTGDPKQLPPKNHICDPAKDLPLVIGLPLPKLSIACAIGISQVIPDTAKSSIARYNLPYTLSDVLYKPEINYLTGRLHFMDVLNKLKDRFPSYNGHNTLAATAYNMGEGNQNKTFKYFGATPASPNFDLFNYLAKMPILETKAYVPYILAQNHVIKRESVSSDADGSWFSRNVDAITSYQQMRAGMQNFTSYFERRPMPFRPGELFNGNSMMTVDPSQNSFRVDPSNNSFKVDPSQTSFKVDPSKTSFQVDPSQNSFIVRPPTRPEPQ